MADQSCLTWTGITIRKVPPSSHNIHNNYADRNGHTWGFYILHWNTKTRETEEELIMKYLFILFRYSTNYSISNSRISFKSFDFGTCLGHLVALISRKNSSGLSKISFEKCQISNQEYALSSPGSLCGHICYVKMSKMLGGSFLCGP